MRVNLSVALIAFILPTQPAGSIGGLTLYKHGDAFGMRSRAYPKRVRSAAHTKVMAIIGDLSMDWEIALTGADRAGWGTYGYNSPLTDAYGNPRYIRGYAQYMRSNRPRIQHGLSRIDPPPGVYGYPPYTLPVLQLPAGNATVNVTIDPSDDWANEDGAAMLLWISTAISPTRNRPPEVYQPLGVIPGSSTIPPISPIPFTLPQLVATVPQTLFIRSSVTRADGRLSGG